jgi:6-phosphofructokinase 1
VDVVGIRDGFLGLIENRMLPLDRHSMAGILTVGGTVLGTSRVKPHRMEGGGRVRDMRDRILANCARNRLDAIVCIGGDGTQRNAIRLVEKGLPVITLPKTIDNDVV